jgi:hypothetical protein
MLTSKFQSLGTTMRRQKQYIAARRNLKRKPTPIAYQLFVAADIAYANALREMMAFCRAADGERSDDQHNGPTAKQ